MLAIFIRRPSLRALTKPSPRFRKATRPIRAVYGQMKGEHS
jgi:hypothetical protein